MGRVAPAWKFLPMWLYAAHGSGVSINVGVTRVVYSDDEASHLLDLTLYP